MVRTLVLFGVLSLCVLTLSPEFVGFRPSAEASHVPRPAGVPAGYESRDDCVAGHGRHWFNPRSPNVAIYGVYRGRVMFIEYKIAQQAFAEGKSWMNLRMPSGRRVDHVDIEFSKGHEDFTSPHYDIHFWFVPRSVHMSMRPPC